MTFRDLATVYQERQLQPAEDKGERQISGRRCYYSPQLYLKVLTEHCCNSLEVTSWLLRSCVIA